MGKASKTGESGLSISSRYGVGSSVPDCGGSTESSCASGGKGLPISSSMVYFERLRKSEARGV
eukprot:37134-Pleurochrysis_carterae.AAC.2